MKKYWAIFKIQLQDRLTYKGDLVTQSISIVLFLFVFLQLWRTTYNASGTDSIAGMTLADTMWYLMIAETAVLSRPRLTRNISDAVKDGSIAYQLNKPYHFILYHFSAALGETIPRMFFNMLMGSVLVILSVVSPPSIQGWLAAIVALILGWLIDFCITAMIGLSAFVTEDVSAFDWIYSKIQFILGGLLIPLDFFPSWLRSISMALPFAYTVYGPARLFTDPTPERFFNVLIGQIIWMGVLGSLLFIIYRRSERRLAINGG
jgi:ABC-2 type transport system permease protein